ncbi:MAG: hypothetical protein DRJ97_02445 [Thermoprotei archaeon]|nr:MAG: hypothetical protein DRJ97_02445 [Thermoprotei archaeon]
MGPSRSLRSSTVALTAALLFMVSIVNPYVYHAAQILFAVIFTVGILIVDAFGCATLIALIGGLLHSFTSIIGPLVLPSWLVRGTVADVLLKALRVYGSHPHPTLKVAVAMTASSLITGIFHYVVIVKGLGLIPEPPFPLLLAIFAVASSSTFAGSLIAVKVVNRLGRTLRWYT